VIDDVWRIAGGPSHRWRTQPEVFDACGDAGSRISARPTPGGGTAGLPQMGPFSPRAGDTTTFDG
jgi:hypothetical protein